MYINILVLLNRKHLSSSNNLTNGENETGNIYSRALRGFGENEVKIGPGVWKGAVTEGDRGDRDTLSGTGSIESLQKY